MCFEFTPVESSTIEAIGFYLSDKEMMDGDLYIRFKNGGVFRYFQVPENRYNAFMSAESKGKYYSEFIKKKYQGERVGSEQDDDVTDAHGIPIDVKKTAQGAVRQIKKDVEKVSDIRRKGVTRIGSIEL